MKTRRPIPPVFQPQRNDECLCGSGKKHKRCCLPHLPRKVLGVSARTLLASENYSDAIVECRADITQYTIWYKSHTEPLLQDAPERAQVLFDLDIKSLSELVHILLRCCAKTSYARDIPEVLERLRANVHQPRWQRKITYFFAVDAYLARNDPTLARAELRKLGPIIEESDSETLQLYLDLFAAQLSFSSMQDLIDRILRFSESESEQLHYRSLKAIQYFEIGDNPKAESELDTAIARFRVSGDAKKMSAYAIDILASALDLLGSLRGDSQLLDEAIGLYQEALRLDAWTLAGRARLFSHLGETFRHKASWDQALEAYRSAAHCEAGPIVKVFMAECYLQLNQIERAMEEVASVDVSLLNDAERTDYVFVFSAISVETGDHEKLEQSGDLLKRQELVSPFFRSRRDTLLLSVVETQRNGKSSSLIKAARKAIAGIFARANRYLLLEPNVMGFGIRGNAILSDLAKAADQHAADIADNEKR
jgi:tetratricopeptide (TPR) repeat protein